MAESSLPKRFYPFGQVVVDRSAYGSEGEKIFYEEIIKYIDTVAGGVKNLSAAETEITINVNIKDNLPKMIDFAERVFPEGKKILNPESLRHAIGYALDAVGRKVERISPKKEAPVVVEQQMKKQIYDFAGLYVIDRNNYKSEEEKKFNEAVIVTIEKWIETIKTLPLTERKAFIEKSFYEKTEPIRRLAQYMYPKGVILANPFVVFPYLFEETGAVDNQKGYNFLENYRDYINVIFDPKKYQSAMELKYYPLIYDRIRKYGNVVENYKIEKDREAIKAELENLKNQGFFKDLEQAMRKEFPDGLPLLHPEILTRLVQIQLENGKEDKSIFEYNREKLKEDFLEERIPSTEAFGGKKYYYPRKKGVLENVVPSSRTSRGVFCPEAPYLIPETEIPNVKIGGKQIDKDVLVNPLMCTSEMTPEIKQKIHDVKRSRHEKRYFSLKDIDSRLKKEVNNFCFPQGQNPRCIKYYEPVEVGEISYKKEEKKKFVYTVIPEVIIEDYEGLVEEGDRILQVYKSYYDVFHKYIPFIISRSRDVKILGSDWSKDRNPYSNKVKTVVVSCVEGEYCLLTIDPDLARESERRDTKFIFVPVAYISWHFVKDNWSHALSLLVDNEARTFEFFGPDGSEFQMDNVYPKIIEAGEKLFPGYTQISKESCPRVSFQSMSADANDLFCAAWNYFYLENYIKAREKTPLESFREISFQQVLRDELLKRGGRNYIYRTIISYICYIYREIFSSFSSFDSSAREAETLLKEIPLYSIYVSLL